MPTTKPADLWNDLNDRQRAYLKAVYDLDQAAEQAEKSGDWMSRSRRPASEWRWIPYTAHPKTGETPQLQINLREKGLVDPGTGSPFEALESRGLIQCRYDLHSAGRRLENWLFVQMTTLGRKVVRSATGEKREKAQPPGTLREWHWKALALAYAAGEKGVRRNEWGNYGGVGWNTWLRLREYKWGALAIDDKADKSKLYFETEYRMFITDFGRQYYEREYQRYRAMYPDVEAPEPDSNSPGG